MDYLPPTILGVMMFMIPIIAILTNHQRKMAELMHARNQADDPRARADNEMLRREIAELRALMHQQAIAIDNLAPRLAPPSASERLENVIR